MTSHLRADAAPVPSNRGYIKPILPISVHPTPLVRVLPGPDPSPVRTGPKLAFDLDAWPTMPRYCVRDLISALEPKKRIEVYLKALQRGGDWQAIAQEVIFQVVLKRAISMNTSEFMKATFIAELKTALQHPDYSMSAIIGPNPDTSGAMPGRFRWETIDGGMETLRTVVRELTLIPTGMRAKRPLALVDMEVEFDYLVNVLEPMARQFPGMSLVLKDVCVVVFYDRRGYDSKLIRIPVALEEFILQPENLRTKLWRDLDRFAPELRREEILRLNLVLFTEPFQLLQQGSLQNGLRTVLLERQPELFNKIKSRQNVTLTDLLRSTARDIIMEADQPARECMDNQSLLAFTYNGQPVFPQAQTNGYGDRAASAGSAGGCHFRRRR